jgi:hypothetical protein
MAIKPSGPLSFTEIAAEFSAAKPYSLSQFYRGGQYVPNSPSNNKVPTTGAIKFSDFYGAAKQYLLQVNSNTENLNIFNLFVSTYGNPGTQAVNLLVDIKAGVIVGGVGANALTVGQFPAGSQITIDNRGSIQGFAGGRNSGAGGSGVYGAYSNQTMVLNNYGGVLAGGGGGGVGGTGGKGGNGFYDTPQELGASGCWIDGGKAPFCGNCGLSACECKFGAGAYCRSGGMACATIFCNGCAYCSRNVRSYTTGGAGGGPGAGGFGQGYARARTDGNGGAGGAPGGTNAGTGGTGGKGGIGGDWGKPGAKGNTGGTGANGNNGAGAAGAAGAGGGAAGNYLIKGGANFTFNNQGTVAGGLA